MVIAGAGVVGLACALEFAAAGLGVTVIEPGRAMREASWAAGGMLAAHDPENPPPLQPLAEWSLALYPRFLNRIETLTGQRVPLRTAETLQAYENGAKVEQASETGLAGLSCEYRWLRMDEHSLDPRDLCQALPLAARAAGVTLEEGCRVSEVTRQAGELEIQTSGGRIRAASFVDCRGAWSAAAVRPRKGQMLTVMLPEGLCLPVVIRTPQLYLIPRGDGRVVIGATVEDCGFDKRVEPSAIEALWASACALWSPLRQAQVVDCWAGLRPGTADGLPLIGRAAGGDASPGPVFLATGHFRNGILLAPATACLVLALLKDETPVVDITPFAPARFQPASVG